MVDERIGANDLTEQAIAERLDRDSYNLQLSDQQLDGYNHWDDSQGKSSMHIGTEGTCGCGRPRYLLYKYRKPKLNCACS